MRSFSHSDFTSILGLLSEIPLGSTWPGGKSIICISASWNSTGRALWTDLLSFGRSAETQHFNFYRPQSKQGAPPPHLLWQGEM